MDREKKSYPWWCWVLLFVVFGAGIYGWIDGVVDRWKISHFEKMSPKEQQRIADQANRQIQVEAEKRCEGVSDRLMEACVAAMKEKIDKEDDIRFYEEQDER